MGLSLQTVGLTSPMNLVIFILACGFHTSAGQSCPMGWLDYPGSESCYLITDYRVRYTFALAQTMCKTYDGHLARVDSRPELSWMKTVFKDLTSSFVPSRMSWWLDLKDMGDGKGVRFGDGAAPQIRLLFGKSGIPDPTENSTECGSFINGTATMTKCTRWLGAVCERSKATPLLCDVDNGWTFMNGSCFKIFNDQLEWKDASAYCKTENADLAKVVDDETLSLTLHLALNASQCWIGARSWGNGKAYKWIDGSVMDISHRQTWWRDGEPKTNRTDATCVVVNADGHKRTKSWLTKPCTDNNAFLCQKPPGLCKLDWVPYRNFCFRMFPKRKKGWAEARDFCKEKGAELVTIKTKEFQKTFNYYLRPLNDGGVDSIWIGLNSEKGPYNWVDGTPVGGTWNNWKGTPSLPDDGEEACVYIETDDRQGKWHISNNCTDEIRPFACMLDSTKPVKETPTTPAPQCASGWESTPSGCVFVSDAKVSYVEAMHNCNQLQATLLAVDTQEKYAEFGAVPRELVIGYWIGLSKTTKGFTWPNGDLMQFSQWANGFPQVGESCVVAIGKRFMWRTQNCTMARNYICFRPVDTPLLPQYRSAVQSGRCGVGWEERAGTDQCYLFVHTLSTWQDAGNTCEKNGGDMVSVAGLDEQSYLEGRLSGQDTEVYWIGLSDQSLEGAWVWKDGTPGAYFNWHAGEPNDMNTENCAAIHTESMQWYDYRCDLRAGFVCRRQAMDDNTTSPLPPTTMSVPDGKFYGCERGWLGYGTSCFRINRNPASWSQAQISCRQNGAELASLGSTMENDFVLSHIPTDPCQDLHDPYQCKQWASVSECSKNSFWMTQNCRKSCQKCGTPCMDKATALRCQYWGSIGECAKNKIYMSENCARTCGCNSTLDSGYWLGLNDLHIQMSYIWSDHSKVTYTNWRVNEPGNFMGGNEDCVRLNSRDGLWSDEPCDLSNTGFICEKPMAVMDTPTISPDQVGCPIASFGIGHLCYRIVDAAKTWQDAKAYCESVKGHLATVNDRLTGAFITSELMGKTQSYWLGLYSVDQGYQWSTGDALRYLPWAPSHNKTVPNSCVAVRSQRPVGLWEDLACQDPHPFVCQLGRQGFTTPTTPTTPTSPTTPIPTTPIPCTQGWVGHQDMCYKAFTEDSERKNWNQAQEICTMFGASLPSIHDSSTNDFLVTLFGNYFTDTIWIGLSDQVVEGSFVWSDGTPFGDYGSWNYGEPNNANNFENCVTLQNQYGRNIWNDMMCRELNVFACAVPRGFPVNTLPPTLPPTKPPSCSGDDRWVYHKGFCYFVSPAFGVDAKKSWFDALRFCKASGGNLASFNSTDEVEFVNTMLPDNDNEEFWIGLNQLMNDKYVWSDGSPLIFENWFAGEPNDGYGSERCVDLRAYGGLWVDDICVDEKRYICKKRNSSMGSIPVPTPKIHGVCPTGFIGSGLNNKCFKVRGVTPDDPPLDFETAIQKCASTTTSGTGRVELASISSLLDQDFATLLLENITSDLWIGLSDRKRSGTFFWHDNREVTYTNWASGYPKSHAVDSNGNCVKMQRATRKVKEIGRWMTKPCDDALPYLCQTSKVAVPTTAPASSGTDGPKNPIKYPGCPETFIRYRSVCFAVINQLKTWSEARTRCQFFQGDLASVQDIFELAWLDLQLYNFQVRPAVWIGLSYKQSNGQFQWSDGWPLDLTFWSGEDPNLVNTNILNNNNNSICTSMQHAQWNDTLCDAKRPFICEVRAAPPSTPEPFGDCANPNHMPFGRYCYMAKPNAKVSWAEASYLCGRMGMQLTSVHSDYELRFVLGLVKLDDNEDTTGYSIPDKLWLGLRRNAQGSFYWMDGSAMDYYNWASNEPSSLANSSRETMSTYSEECVIVHSDMGQWYDVDCADTDRIMGYVCKTEAIFSTTLPPTTSTTPPTFSVPAGQAGSTAKNTGYNVVPSAEENWQYEYSSGLTVGQIAGIVLGILGFAVIVFASAYIVRTRLRAGKSTWANLFSKDAGFDNALYSCGNEGQVNFSNEDVNGTTNPPADC